MFKGIRVGVVIPAYNEERLIAATLRAIPAFVDRIFVIDDSSRDATSDIARSVADCRAVIVRHTTNRGVGGAIITGYREAMRQNLEVAVVMAGDGQMDPADLPGLLEPIAAGDADYVKGNRFLDPAVVRTMPRLRLVGNLALSMLTRPATGYSHIMDSQCGYTAVTCEALSRVDLQRVYPRYGFPNDFLANLHSAGCRVVQVPVRTIYAGEASGINPLLAIAPLTFVLARAWYLRRFREGTRNRLPPPASRLQPPASRLQPPASSAT